MTKLPAGRKNNKKGREQNETIVTEKASATRFVREKRPLIVCLAFETNQLK